MSRMKDYAEKLSVVLGFEGEINPEVLAVGTYLQNLAEQYGLVINVGEQSLTLHRRASAADYYEQSMGFSKEEAERKAAELHEPHDPAAANEDALFRTGGTGPASDAFKR